MRVIASLAVFTALGFVAWEVWKKAQAAQVTATAGLQATQAQAKVIAAAKPLPFGLAPVLTGGPGANFAGVLQAVSGLLKAPASYQVPALAAPSAPAFPAPTNYTGNVVPTDADLLSFGITSPAQPTNAGVNVSGNALSIPFDETADLDAYYGN
jgi:hypothetical protein